MNLTSLRWAASTRTSSPEPFSDIQDRAEDAERPRGPVSAACAPRTLPHSPLLDSCDSSGLFWLVRNVQVPQWRKPSRELGRQTRQALFAAQPSQIS